MSKLSSEEKFLDVSDYGRPIAIFLTKLLIHTKTTPVQVTLVFGLCGLIAVYCILKGYYLTAGIFLILKSIIDAVDGELARRKNIQSYTGRYLDSIFDIILNFFIILAIWHITNHSIWLAFAAFFSLQLQGTLYNYYYVILRHNSIGGDKTSKIFETKTPKAYPRESQTTVNVLFKLYTLFYSLFDKIIYRFDHNASKAKPFPKWFMTFLSVYGLGFQLLIIAVMLAAGWVEYIIPFLIVFSVFIIVFIALRKLFMSEEV